MRTRWGRRRVGGGRGCGWSWISGFGACDTVFVADVWVFSVSWGFAFSVAIKQIICQVAVMCTMKRSGLEEPL